MAPQPFLFEDLHAEILSWLPVKSLVKFMCVSKTWKSLISDSQFVKLHLRRSASRNTGFSQAYLMIRGGFTRTGLGQEFVVYPSISSLLGRHSAMVAIRSCLPFHTFSGSCNGLICLAKREWDHATKKYFSQVCFWNLATRLKSQHSPPLYEVARSNFGFGYDCSSDTYKVVAPKQTVMNVYNMGDNCWRTIQVSTLPSLDVDRGEAVYVSNTLNWLANVDASDDDILNIDPLTIVSFDLGKEELTQLSLPFCPPRGIDEIQSMCLWLTLGVLRGFLSLSQYDVKTHNLVVWQMKQFGVNKSWTQLFNITCSQEVIYGPSFAICMSENDDVLLLGKVGFSAQAALYTKRRNKLEGSIVCNKFRHFQVKNYIESLVSPY